MINFNSGSTPSSLPNIEIEHQLGGIDSLIPYIISPRLTFLLNDKPTLCWNEVPGTTYYLVRVMKDSEILWEEKVSDTKVVYSGNPPLEPGFTYLLTVETDNGVSSLDSNETRLGFKIIDHKIAQEVQAVVTEINQKNDFTAEAKAIRNAQLFNALNIKDEAIRTLEGLLAEHQFEENQKKIIFLTLAKLYGGVGLNLLAEEYYSKAIALASAAEDLKVLGEAKAGLAGVKIMLALGKKDEAEQLSHQAQAIYRELGDLESARQIEERIAELANKLEARKSSLRSSSLPDVIELRAAKFPPCHPWRECGRD